MHNHIKKDCEYKSNGCKQEITIPNYKRHLNACAFNPNNIKHCKFCNKKISYGDAAKNRTRDVKDKKFCNRSCGAKYNNARRVVTKEHKNNIRNGINIFYDESPDFRKYGADEIKKKKHWINKWHRYTEQQLKELKPELYEYWQSNPYTGGGDTSKLSIEHGGESKTELAYARAMKYGLSIPEVFNIDDIEIIPYCENNKREQDYRKQQILILEARSSSG
tara:strand:+ start:404 stop:1063 length:660 start_codon:yes stop_codon:yes gene_type:complete